MNWDKYTTFQREHLAVTEVFTHYNPKAKKAIFYFDVGSIRKNTQEGKVKLSILEPITGMVEVQVAVSDPEKYFQILNDAIYTAVKKTLKLTKRNKSETTYKGEEDSVQWKITLRGEVPSHLEEMADTEPTTQEPFGNSPRQYPQDQYPESQSTQNPESRPVEPTEHQGNRKRRKVPGSVISRSYGAPSNISKLLPATIIPRERKVVDPSAIVSTFKIWNGWDKSKGGEGVYFADREQNPKP